MILFYAGSSSDGKCVRAFPRTAFNVSDGCRRRFTFEPMCQSSRIPTMAALLSRMATARRASRRASRKPRIRVLEVLFRNVIRCAATRSFFSELQQKDCVGSGSYPCVCTPACCSDVIPEGALVENQCIFRSRARKVSRRWESSSLMLNM